MHLKDIAMRVGRHEAGHYVVARALGFKAGDCFLNIIGPFDEHTGGSKIELYSPLRTKSEILSYLEKRVQVLYAGALAQSLENGNINNEKAIECVRNHSGRNDYDKARELIQLIRNIRYPETDNEDEVQKNLNDIDGELWNKAADCVLADQNIIEGLGARLADGVKSANVKYTIEGRVINSLPEIVKRFGN
jgi:hypothetical protein